MFSDRWQPFSALVALLGVVTLLHAQRAQPVQPAATAPTGDALLRYVNDVIDWHQRVTSLSQGAVNAQELLYRETARQNAREVLRATFDFARAEAALIDARQRDAAGSGATTAPPSARGRGVAQAAAAIAGRATELEAQLADLDRQLQSAPPTPDSSSW